MDKLSDGDGDQMSTFEETLQRFVGLSSEEIWELQRILLRRVRCKLSETLSPEGKTAMKQVKQEMHERHVQKISAPASLVTELIDMGSKQTEGNVQPEHKVSNIVLTVSKDGESFQKSVDVIEEVADENTDNTENGTDNTTKLNGDTVKPVVEMAADDNVEETEDNAEKADVNGKVADGNELVTNGVENAKDVTKDSENCRDAQIQEESTQERVVSRESSRNAGVGSRESSRSVRISSRGSSRNVNQENVQDVQQDQNSEIKEETILNGQIHGQTTEEEIRIKDEEGSEVTSQKKSLPNETINTSS